MRASADIRRVCWLLVCGTACLGSVSTVPASAAQAELVASIDSHQVYLGDAVGLRLQVDGPPSQQIQFPTDLSDQLPDHMIATPATSPPGIEAEARYVLRVYKLGETTIPSLQVAVISGADTMMLASAPLDLEVRSRLGDAQAQLRDIKPPWVIAGGIPVWIIALLGLLLLILVGWLAYRFLLRRQPSTAAVRMQPTDFLREFARIEAMGLLERGALKLYYTHLADILRRLLEERWQIDAMERTTEEIAVDVARHGLSDDALTRQIVDYLTEADLVKFARAEPPTQVARHMPGRGRQIVQIMDEKQAQATAEAEAEAASEDEVKVAAHG